MAPAQALFAQISARTLLPTLSVLEPHWPWLRLAAARGTDSRTRLERTMASDRRMFTGPPMPRGRKNVPSSTLDVVARGRALPQRVDRSAFELVLQREHVAHRGDLLRGVPEDLADLGGGLVQRPG